MAIGSVFQWIEFQIPILKMQVRFLPGLRMFFAYVIKSLDSDFLYKGHCKNLEERLKQHNSGMTRSLRPYLPFEIAYSETFETRDEAMRREKYFKSAAGRRFLKEALRISMPARPNK